MTLTASPEIKGEVLFFRNDKKAVWYGPVETLQFQGIMFLACLRPESKQYLTKEYLGVFSKGFADGEGGNAAGKRLFANDSDTREKIVFKAT